MNIAANLYLGTWQFEDTDQARQIQLIRHARTLGIDKFDTARVYDEGRAEAMLGKYGGTDVTVVTKIPALSRSPDVKIEDAYTREHIVSSINASRQNIGWATLHVLLHNWNPRWEYDSAGQEKVMSDLSNAASSYEIEKVGVSLPNGYSGEFEDSVAHDYTDIVELPFNSRSSEITAARIKRFSDTKLVLARSIFEHGDNVVDVSLQIADVLANGAQAVIGTKSPKQMEKWIAI